MLHRRYLCGLDYFEKGRRLFAANCSECVVVHNNWIVGREAKVYRFKEHLQWMYDKDSYYTDATRDYLTYANPIPWPNKKASVSEELEALRAALMFGQLLNRFVILPRFHCTAADLGIALSTRTRRGRSSVRGKDLPRIECPLNGLLNITAFDAVFGDRYRESSFLQHPLVKEDVKTGLSRPYLITHAQNMDLEPKLTSAETGGIREVVVLPFPNRNLTEASVLERFGNSTSRVLVFRSLYRTVPEISDANRRAEFERKFKLAFQPGQYRQL